MSKTTLYGVVYFAKFSDMFQGLTELIAEHNVNAETAGLSMDKVWHQDEPELAAQCASTSPYNGVFRNRVHDTTRYSAVSTQS